MSNKRNQTQALDSPTSSTSNGDASHLNHNDHFDKKFKHDHGDGDEDEDDDDDEDAPKGGKRAGRRKIKIEYIEDKSRRHITFSKRKSGIMKKAYELSTLTGTQVLLLVVSETGLVYTFTTPKLQPLVTKAEGKNLIQACLHAPDKEATPDDTPAERESSEPRQGGEYDDRTSPQGNNASGSSQQNPSSQASPQQPQQSYPPQSGQQQQPGGYGSSSAMSVPSYPHPYSHIPFPAQYNYPSNMHYQNGPPPPNGNQYWSGPPPAASTGAQVSPQQSSPTSAPQAVVAGGKRRS
ncbi:transcription factor of the MADS box [Lobosporangium transversale]|uniref:MADS-box domain-containing protein n=1 Tax=Lobosporangium transversale TaxID=64571 RepID=A0A1Y2GZY7_9FUNG|nr:hypothetical protein BCR41DRAFT_153391 [Lobosporangium transversale]KAF9913689.1 transcription factor of the MADS box [Lobosporangium transversale]ORZ27311.1 hypothetical protein BCR41DRAFT_153391 [Lobosporangium transversale]|eukprot:XP_021885038.1 hypothetical protein BCR41DRAFT_153391 [Lobosporangium transversale]